MPSFRISVTPSRRAAGRFVTRVRRAIQKALAEEQSKSGINQSAIARAIGVHRSVINREIRGQKDLTLGRVAELAWALGRKPIFELPEIGISAGANHLPDFAASIVAGAGNVSGNVSPPTQGAQTGTNTFVQVAA